MSAHTPGPWTAEDAVLRLGRYLEADIRVGSRESAGNIIATVFMGGGGATLNNKAVVEANARLIAAAPEMLEALQALLQCPEIADCDPRDKDEETVQAEKKARAALRALGQQDTGGADHG